MAAAAAVPSAEPIEGFDKSTPLVTVALAAAAAVPSAEPIEGFDKSTSLVTVALAAAAALPAEPLDGITGLKVEQPSGITLLPPPPPPPPSLPIFNGGGGCLFRDLRFLFWVSNILIFFSYSTTALKNIFCSGEIVPLIV